MRTLSTGHRVTVDIERMIVTVERDDGDIYGAPAAEIDAVCSEHDTWCTYQHAGPNAYELQVGALRGPKAVEMRQVNPSRPFIEPAPFKAPPTSTS